MDCLYGHVQKYEAQLLTSINQRKMKFCHKSFRKHWIEFKTLPTGYIHGLKPFCNTTYPK